MRKRKTNRPYTKTNPLIYARVKEWYLQKLALGTNKTIARELNLSPERVTQLCAQIRLDLEIEGEKNPWAERGGWTQGRVAHSETETSTP